MDSGTIHQSSNTPIAINKKLINKFQQNFLNEETDEEDKPADHDRLLDGSVRNESEGSVANTSTGYLGKIFTGEGSFKGSWKTILVVLIL